MNVSASGSASVAENFRPFSVPADSDNSGTTNAQLVALAQQPLTARVVRLLTASVFICEVLKPRDGLFVNFELTGIQVHEHMNREAFALVRNLLATQPCAGGTRPLKVCYIFPISKWHALAAHFARGREMENCWHGLRQHRSGRFTSAHQACLGRSDLPAERTD